MERSRTLASAGCIVALAMACSGALAQDGAQQQQPQPQAQPQPVSQETLHQKIEQREAQRRVAMEEHQKRKEHFARHCTKPVMTPAELEACRAAYRAM